MKKAIVCALMAALALPAVVLAQDASSTVETQSFTRTHVCLTVDLTEGYSVQDAIFDDAYSIVASADCTNPDVVTYEPTRERPLKVKGKGGRKSRPFMLAGGDYEVQVKWKGCRKERRQWPSLYTADLVSVDDGNQLYGVRDSDYAYDIPDGRYYVDVDTASGGSNCGWQVTVRPMVW